LNNNDLNLDIPIDLFNNLPKLTSLLIKSNKINKILLGTLQNIPSLKTLDAGDNSIRKLETNTFYGTQNLVKFLMNKNHLSSMDSVFLGQNNLKCVSLEYNRLNSLPNYLFAALSQLVEVNLGDNELTSLPKDLFKKSFKLKKILLDHNLISTLSITIFDGLTDLEWVSLTENKMLSMSNEVFKSLVNLENVEIDSNVIIDSDSNFFSALKGVESLSLLNANIGNELSRLPLHLFDGLSNLKTIFIQNHKNPIFPSDLFQTIKQLESLDLKYNRMTNVPNSFRKLTKLKRLVLSNNQIKSKFKIYFIFFVQLHNV
jgi:Leucine-rich repeat (LRR) protein